MSKDTSTQTEIDAGQHQYIQMKKAAAEKVLEPKQKMQMTYPVDRIIAKLEQIELELVYLRHEWEDNKKDSFDNNELLGRLATKIEEWVGVAEETG